VVSPEIKSEAFKHAVVSIQRRAEKITDLQKLGEIFVPLDARARVETFDTQLILGRRGTGKTHLIRAFQDDAQRHGQVVLNYDCTRLGSGYSGLDVPAVAIATKYFAALLNQLGTDLHDLSLRMENAHRPTQHDTMTRLVDSFVPLMSPAQAHSELSLFNYAQIARTIEHVFRSLALTRILLILDEWAQIPFHAQPYFAEFIKRSLASIPAISLKLVAVNYQCQFSKLESGNIIGLQRGADIPDIVDLDGYLIFAERGDVVADFFAQVLYNHLGVELQWDLSADLLQKRLMTEALFTQRDTFFELVRAAEGNWRDFLCIFAKAYFDEFRTSTASKSVSKPNIVRAATEWFDSEKLASIRAEKEVVDTLTYVMDKVLKGYKSRTFMVETDRTDHPRLVRLLNERIFHKLSGTYATKDRAGVRYDLFSVDYGAFARFRGTARQVDERIFLDSAGLESDQRGLLVPVDDRRSIRRIIFDPNDGSIRGHANGYTMSDDNDLPLWRCVLDGSRQ